MVEIIVINQSLELTIATHVLKWMLICYNGRNNSNKSILRTNNSHSHVKVDVNMLQW